MVRSVLVGSDLIQMIQYSSALLEKHTAQINDLNVFPVPDGDTGTNMSLTMKSGYESVLHTNSNQIDVILPAFSRGLLMGARGNSGVILSQIFAGFSQSLQNNQAITIDDLVTAFRTGAEFAYKAVTDPVEGTILTVIKETADGVEQLKDDSLDVADFLTKVVHFANESLDRTPDKLPILKEVGVVDSGGKGLVVILEGFLNSILGEELPTELEIISTSKDKEDIAKEICQTEQDITYGYCTEFMIELSADDYHEDHLREQLGSEGDSLVVVSTDDLVKVHIHTEHPGQSLNIAQQYGSLNDIKIDNMRKQQERVIQKQKSNYGLLTVSSGEGNKQLFHELGVTKIIEGGQTMNPSIQSFVDTIHTINAESIIILPNNKNVLLAAEEARKIVDVDVLVVPTTSIQEGLAALYAFDTSLSLAENDQNMQDAMEDLVTGQVTKATRTTSISGLEIQQGHMLGLRNNEIVTTGENEFMTFVDLIDKMIEDDSELITILLGEDAESSKEQVETYLEDTYQDLEVEVFDGGQAVYPYLISVE